MLIYLDTSAAMKLVIEEPESAALVDVITAGGRRLVASWLLHTELHCAAGRRPEAVDLGAVTTVLEAVDLVDITRGDLIAAGTLAPLRSNDAIHLAVAIRLGVDGLLTYDHELAATAVRAGLQVSAPN